MAVCFSNIFGIPSYQRDAVSGILRSGASPILGYHHYVNNGDFSTVKGGVYHHGGRAYPDVAAEWEIVRLVYANWFVVAELGNYRLAAPMLGCRPHAR